MIKVRQQISDTTIRFKEDIRRQIFGEEILVIFRPCADIEISQFQHQLENRQTRQK